MNQPILDFPPFRLDIDDATLWHGSERIPLPAKELAVLHYLITHSGRLVTLEELLNQVWANVKVSPEVLKVRIGKIRRTLGDSVQSPRFIENVHGKGYRFIAKVVSSQYPVTSSPFPLTSPEQRRTDQQQLTAPLVGREQELAHLHDLFAKATSGERRVVFVTGEPGIGKTALVDAFLQQVQETSNWRLETSSTSLHSSSLKTQALRPWIARGQCIEQYGASEAYLPVLEALERLGRTADREHLKRALGQYAPTWLLHLPALLTAEEATALQPRILGVRQERMMRELAEALEALTAEEPLILVFEDLHWADASTLTLLSLLTYRREAARLLLLGTYRSSAAAGKGSPLLFLTQDLAAHHLSHELALPLLDETAVAAYLSARFPQSLFPTRFAHLLHQRTEGNPLFVVSMVHDLIEQGVLAQTEGTWAYHGDLDALTQKTPKKIRQLLTSQRVRLQPQTQQVLEAASVAGMEFSAAEVAAALETAVAVVEEQCARLAEQQQFLRPAGISEWPDHTRAAKYAFLHALYQHHWHERVSPTRLQEWHKRIGERKEAAYGDRASEIAAELAVHFEQGRTYGKALHYLSQAAEIALRRSANPEAINYLTKALELLPFLPDMPERAQQELKLQVALGAPLMMTKGYTAPEVKGVYNRAWELCREIGETSQLFPVLVGLSRFYYGRNSSRRAHELREQLLQLAHNEQDPSLLLVAHMNLGGNLFFQGKFAQAYTHADQGVALYDPLQHGNLIFLHGDAPEVTCRCWAALALWYLGSPDQALDKIYQALQIAQKLAHPFGLAFALFWTAFLHQARGEVQKAREQTTALTTLTQEHGIPQFLAMGAIVHSWALAEQGHEEGIPHLQRGIASLQATRQELGRPYFLALLAEAYGNRGQVEEGMKVLTEALDITHTTGECMHQAELYRLKGQLTLQQQLKAERQKSKVPNPQRRASSTQDVETCFQKAIEIARQQQAKSLELRAAVSLARLWGHQGKSHPAHAMLAEIYSWFTEGFATADLQEAQTLLEELA